MADTPEGWTTCIELALAEGPDAALVRSEATASEMWEAKLDTIGTCLGGPTGGTT